MDIFVDQLSPEGANAQVNDSNGLWTSCSEALREQVSDSTWKAYLSGVSPLSVTDVELVLGVPNTLVRDRVESRYLGLIQDTVAGTVGRHLIVRLELLPPAPEPELEMDAVEPLSDHALEP